VTAAKDGIPRAGATARLSVGGTGDDLAAVSLRKSAESLLACGIDELSVDLSPLDDANPAFLRALATLTATARAHSCELFVIGVQSPALLAALNDAPLDELFAIYEAACRHDTRRVSVVPPNPAAAPSPGGCPEPARVITPALAQTLTASAAGGPADATGGRHARTERIGPTPTHRGAPMISTHPEATPPEWIDRLVDLHVLAAHGDTDAAAQADRWMADEPDARRLWDSVAGTCEQLRAASA
jgi:anti-anti-sigma regulatory factor